MENSSSNPMVTNCTFSGNYASEGSGGMENWGSNSTVTNCILWANTSSGSADESAQILIGSGTLQINYCCVQGWTGGLGGTGNIGNNPLFVDADGSDNVFGTEDDNLRLLGDSPCLDAGDNDAVPADITDLDNDGNTVEPIPWDLDGNPRIVDGNNDGSAVVDMGAYEYFVPPIEVSIKLTSNALGLGNSDLNRGRKVDLDMPGFVTSPTSGEGSILNIQSDGQAGTGTVSNPLLVTITARTHLDVTNNLPPAPHDYHAGVIFISKESSEQPDGRKEGLGVRAFKVDGPTGLRQIDSGSGLAKIEGSKHISGGTDDDTYDPNKPNGAPHVDEAVKFEFNKRSFEVIAQSVEVLLSEFAPEEIVDLHIELTSGPDIDLTFLQTTDANIFELVGDKVWKLKLSGVAGLGPDDLIDNFTIRANDDNPASPRGTAEHFWISGLTVYVRAIPPTAVVPNVVGLSQTDANSAITAVDLAVGAVTYEYCGAITAGVVIGQNPVGGTVVPVGSSVDLVVFNSCADLYSDGVVDYLDLRIFAENWLWMGTPGDNAVDLNCNGSVDFVDFAIFALQWLRSCP